MTKEKKPLFLPTIIKSSGNVTMLVRIRDAVLTVALWFIYLYLLHDCYFFAMDIFHWLHDGTGEARAYPKLRIFQTMKDYSLGLLLLATVFIGWAQYNRIRFAGKKRRKTTEAVSVDDLARMYKLDAKNLEGWQKKRSLIVHNDAKGRVTKVEAVH